MRYTRLHPHVIKLPVLECKINHHVRGETCGEKPHRRNLPSPPRTYLITIISASCTVLY